MGYHREKHNRSTWIDMYLLYCRCLSCINPDDGLINLSETCRQDLCTKYILRLTENLDSFPRDWAVRYGVYCIKLSLLSTIWRTIWKIWTQIPQKKVMTEDLFWQIKLDVIENLLYQLQIITNYRPLYL